MYHSLLLLQGDVAGSIPAQSKILVNFVCPKLSGFGLQSLSELGL